MSLTRHFASFTLARGNFRAVLDAAAQGFVTTVDREDERFVIVAAAHQREDIARMRPSGASVVAEGGGWAVLLPGLPLHGDGATFEAAIQDAIVALREYAEDWNARLRAAPNHVDNRPVVELVELSSDEQLRDWLLAAPQQETRRGAKRLQPA